MMPSTSDDFGFGSTDPPPDLSKMFINSCDTLRHRGINQEMSELWNDRPPLFMVSTASRQSSINSNRQSFLQQWRQWQSQPTHDESEGSTSNVSIREKPPEEDPNLLKGMIRKGIPPSLRCAVWLSNIIQSCRSDQGSLNDIHEFRTLSRVRIVDSVYKSLWNNEANEINNDSAAYMGSYSAVTKISKSDAKKIDFGNSAMWNKINEEKCPGVDSMMYVLYALHQSVLGDVVHCPSLVSLVSILLGYMSESYVFYACREMYYHSTWYFSCSRSEQIATQRAFSHVLGRLHPHTLEVMEENGVIGQYTKEIFQNFFVNVMPEYYVSRLFDIYSLEGKKVLFRFGVALAVLYGKEFKDHYMYASAEPNKWWLGLSDFCYGGVASKGVGSGGVDNKNNNRRSQGLNFEVLIKKAYGVHGRGVSKRFRFPSRPVLTRIIEIEEEKYRNEKINRKNAVNKDDDDCGNNISDDSNGFFTASFDEDTNIEQVLPLDLVVRPQPTDPTRERIVPRLASSVFVRTKLAEWLQISLRFTKLDLVYSTSYHGRTLENLYQCVAKSRHTVLILEPYEDRSCRETSRFLIGMYASDIWHPSSKVYGDGRSFLFRIDMNDNKLCEKKVKDGIGKQRKPGSARWKWHPPDMLAFGHNSFDNYDGDDTTGSLYNNLQQMSSVRTAFLDTFQVSTNYFLSLGGSEHGGAGLRLNEDLTKGESTKADGFDNDPLLPGASGMFEVGLVEIYQIVRQIDGLPVR